MFLPVLYGASRAHRKQLGAKGFIHVANDMSKKASPDEAIRTAVQGALNALTASAKFGLIRFVYTSSSFAATQPKPGKPFTVTAKTYNEEAVERAHQPDPDGETIYSASKVAAEQAIWKWTEDNPSSMVINTGMLRWRPVF
jgi:nucleoside-diphosphate-sugar epimerase